MPSASSRAVTSADEPAGKRTVISSTLLCGNGGSCASTTPASGSKNAAASAARTVQDAVMTISQSIVADDFRDLDAPAFTRRQNSRAHDRQRGRCAVTTHLRRAVSTHRGGKLFQFLDERVDLRAGNVDRFPATAFQHS